LVPAPAPRNWYELEATLDRIRATRSELAAFLYRTPSATSTDRPRIVRTFQEIENVINRMLEVCCPTCPKLRVPYPVPFDDDDTVREWEFARDLAEIEVAVDRLAITCPALPSVPLLMFAAGGFGLSDPNQVVFASYNEDGSGMTFETLVTNDPQSNAYIVTMGWGAGKSLGAVVRQVGSDQVLTLVEPGTWTLTDIAVLGGGNVRGKWVGNTIGVIQPSSPQLRMYDMSGNVVWSYDPGPYYKVVGFAVSDTHMALSLQGVLGLPGGLFVFEGSTLVAHFPSLTPTRLQFDNGYLWMSHRIYRVSDWQLMGTHTSEGPASVNPSVTKLFSWHSFAIFGGADYARVYDAPDLATNVQFFTGSEDTPGESDWHDDDVVFIGGARDFTFQPRLLSYQVSTGALRASELYGGAVAGFGSVRARPFT
jgi:hypothetical protein